MAGKAALIFLAAASAGCGTYWKQRGGDLADCFGIGLFGGGFLASARATHFVQAGFGWELNFERRFRTVGREIRSEGMITTEIGVAPLACLRVLDEGGGSHSETRAIVLGRTYIASDSDESSQWAFLPSPANYRRDYDRRMFDIGVSACCIVGFDFDFSPFEFVDLLLGFAGLDIAGDDRGDKEGAEPECPPCPKCGAPARPESDDDAAEQEAWTVEDTPIEDESR